MKRHELRIIQALREDARARLTELAEQLDMPLSTLHDRLKRLERSGVLRTVSIPYYERIGFALRCWFSIVTKDREAAAQQLVQARHANTVRRVHNGADFLIECIFSSFKQQQEALEEFKKIGKVKTYPVIEALKEEGARCFPA